MNKQRSTEQTTHLEETLFVSLAQEPSHHSILIEVLKEGGFCVRKANHKCNAMLRRNPQTHMDMIYHQMSFEKIYSSLTTQVAQNFTKVSF